MITMAGGGREHRATSKNWAVVHLLLGVAQMSGALTAVILLVQIGPALPTLLTVLVTSLLRVVSWALFRRPRPSPPR